MEQGRAKLVHKRYNCIYSAIPVRQAATSVSAATSALVISNLGTEVVEDATDVSVQESISISPPTETSSLGTEIMEMLAQMEGQL